MMHFCALLDTHFLLRVIALHRSLERVQNPFTLWLLCTDHEVYKQLTSIHLPSVRLLTLEELEKTYPSLKAVLNTRSRYEYLMTCKPFLLRFLLEQEPNINLLCYTDGDLYFLNDFSAIAEEIRDQSVLLTPHHEGPTVKAPGKHGLYNAGFVAVRKSEAAQKMVHWWCEKVLEWCFDRVEGEKFIDQKYLDRVPELFQNVRIASHPGLNLAPWNIGSYTFSQKGEEIFVDGQPVIFYHFHALKKLGPGLYDTGIAPYRTPCSPLVRRLIYSPYIRELQKIRTWLKKTYGFQADVGTVRKENSPMKSLPLAVSRIRKGQWILTI
jgi:hypothetical protein